MIETSADILNIVLAITAAVVGTVLTVLLFYLVGVVRRALHVIKFAEKLIEKVDNYVTKPIAAISEIVDQIRPVVDFIAGFRRRRRD